MANATKPPAKTEYKVVYLIRDGDNEYECTLRKRFDHEPTELECAKVVIANFSSDENTEKECLQELAEEGYFTIPLDNRVAYDFGAEPRLPRSLADAAHEMLQMLKQYSSDCETRLDILRDELTDLGFDEAKERKKYRESDARDLLDQIGHWRATRAGVDALIVKAESL